MKQALGIVALLIAAAFLGHWLFPRQVPGVPPPPRIITVWDTVATIDTAWITRVRTIIKHDTTNLIERVTVTVPETVAVCPAIAGITALDVGEHVGDSTLVGGFQITPLASGIALSRWQAQVWTAGPLRSVLLDTLPPHFAFYPAPQEPRTCGFFCQATRVGVGALIGFGACAIR